MWFDQIISLADKLKVFDAVRNKLVARPDEAAAKMATVLGEISKIYLAAESELTQFLGLFFDPAPDADARLRSSERGKLLVMSGPSLQVRLGETRGSCFKIANIHAKYLSPWFDRVLGHGDDRRKVDEVFAALDDADELMLRTIDELAIWLASEAGAALNLVDAGDLAGAGALILAARKQVQPARDALGRAVRSLNDLNAEFVRAGGVV